MIDLKFLRENPETVKENIRNKFQDSKLPLVDEVIELDVQARKTQQEADSLRAERKKLSKQIGALMGQGKKEEAEAVKAILPFNLIHHSVHFRKAHHAGYHIAADHKRRHAVGKASADHKISCIRNHCGMKPCNIAHQIVKAIACHFSGAVKIKALMIGKFIDTILNEEQLPQTLTSYSPCFRKEKGAHGIEERGVYRIHQFEKQEMIVVCKPEESPLWFEKLWQNTVDLFRSLDVPVRTLECCSGDLADLKVKSVDVEAWSPRQQKYFEVGSCSNLGDAQARRLKIRVNGKEGKYFAHTLNNTVVAPPRMLIAFLENNLCQDGSVRIPEALRPYMGGQDKIVPPEK